MTLSSGIMPGPVSRPARIGLIAAAVVVFLALSILVGRFLGAATSVRDEATGIIKQQAGGDAIAVVRRISGCHTDSACIRRTVHQVRLLRTPGRVRIVRVDGVSSVGLGSRTDTVRVVWKAGRRLPTVQCVRVRRSGNPVTGYDVAVLSLGPVIGREAACPG